MSLTVAVGKLFGVAVLRGQGTAVLCLFLHNIYLVFREAPLIAYILKE